MKDAFLRIAQLKGDARWVQMYSELEAAMPAEKGIWPNLDFASGPAYHLMGFRPLSAYTGKDQRLVPRAATRLAG
jgi:citrate synthase